MNRKYEEFDALPAWTRAVWTDDGKNIFNDADPHKWSGKADPPKIGATVNVPMNRIGKAKVVKYFSEHGWLGLIVKPTNPPDWYVKQNGRRATCHVFGAELESAYDKENA